MRIWQGILLFLLVAIPFTAYIFLRPTLYGYDEYSFAGYVCNGTALPDNTGFLAKAMLDVLPCNVEIFKAFLGLLLLVSTFVVAFTGELFDKNKGWLAGLLCFASSLWLIGSFKFDAQAVFALPFLCLTNYFLCRYLAQGNKTSAWIGTAFLVLSIFVWRGSILFAFAWSLAFMPILLIAVGGAILKGQAILGSITPNLQVTEGMPLIGIVYLAGLLPALFLTHKRLLLPTAILFFFGAMQSKFMPLAIPLLAVSLAANFDKLDLYLKKIKVRVDLRIAVLLIVVVLVGSTIAQVPSLPPNENETAAIKFALAQADGNKICNDWDTGSWIQFYSRNDLQYTRIHGFPNPDYSSCKGVALSTKDLNKYGCSETKQFGYLKVWNC